MLIISDVERSSISSWTIPISILSGTFVALALFTLPAPSIDVSKNKNREKPKNNPTLEQFSGYYLKQLKLSLSNFSTYFSVVGFVVGIQFIGGIFLLLLAFRESVGVVSAIQQVLSFSMLVWLAILVKNFVTLQTEKIENDIVTTIEHRNESKIMSEKILRKAEEKAGHKITVNGDNAMLAIDGGTISGSSQVKNVQGETELMKSLALLISYVEESEEPDAIRAANELAGEATKPEPDKGTIFDLWNKITTITPQVSELVSVVGSVKSLFM